MSVPSLFSSILLDHTVALLNQLEEPCPKSAPGANCAPDRFEVALGLSLSSQSLSAPLHLALLTKTSGSRDYSYVALHTVLVNQASSISIFFLHLMTACFTQSVGNPQVGTTQAELMFSDCKPKPKSTIVTIAWLKPSGIRELNILFRSVCSEPQQMVNQLCYILMFVLNLLKPSFLH